MVLGKGQVVEDKDTNAEQRIPLQSRVAFYLFLALTVVITVINPLLTQKGHVFSNFPLKSSPAFLSNLVFYEKQCDPTFDGFVLLIKEYADNHWSCGREL